MADDETEKGRPLLATESGTMPLEQEFRLFQERLADYLGDDQANEGKFVVICEEVDDYPFESFEEALDRGYDLFGLKDFMVRRIESEEVVHHSSQELV